MSAEKGSPVPGAAPLGLALFLASLAVLFIASIVAYLAVLYDHEVWPPPGMPTLPKGLWLSTVVLLLSSGTIHLALTSARKDRAGPLKGAMAETAGLAVVFLVTQVVCWVGFRTELLASTGTHNQYGGTFYLLTVLHALHVVGGLVPLVVTTARAFKGRYTAESHVGVLLCTMYWHFLDVAWLVIFGTLTYYS